MLVRKERPHQKEVSHMFASVIVILALFIALANAMGSQGLALITPTPYNNPYSDASGARDDHYS
jgi:hypothetical protein